MSPTDEELLHGFYACETAALQRLAERLDPFLARVAGLILRARTGSAVPSRQLRRR